jgi:hypothetical protein
MNKEKKKNECFICDLIRLKMLPYRILLKILCESEPEVPIPPREDDKKP